MIIADARFFNKTLIDKDKTIGYNDYSNKRKGNRTMEKKMVIGFNCFGAEVIRIEESKVEEYNAKHPLFNQQIVSTRPYKVDPKFEAFHAEWEKKHNR